MRIYYTKESFALCDVKSDIKPFCMHGGIGTNSMVTGFLDKCGMSHKCRDDFKEGLKKLAKEQVDLVLGNHPNQNNTKEKLRKVQAGEFVLNPDEWKAFLEKAGKALDRILEKEEAERTLFSTEPDTDGKRAVLK